MLVKSILILTLFCLVGCLLSAQGNDSLALRKIANEELMHGQCYSYLEYLTKKIGERLTGSPQAAAAVEYTYQQMEKIGPDTVYKQECKVPHWVRGEKETGRALTTKSGDYDVKICALGGSVPTPEEGITANIVEVHSFDELKKLGRGGVEGKIVFYNTPFDETIINTFETYGKTVGYRWAGADAASKLGAVATIVRSMTNAMDDNPHTGVMHYNDSVTKIPCCAISTIGAERLSALYKSDKNLRFYIKMSCQTLPDETSYNVIGVLKGTEHPEEIITVGGHLDSWDLAEGAHDDGAGAMQSLELLRTFKALGLKPKRTIRVVMFMNEENGGRGAAKYAETAKKKHEKMFLAMESDAGGFSPRGFGIDGPQAVKDRIKSWAPLFLQYGVYDFSSTEGGSDIEPLKDLGAVQMGLIPDSQRYFDIHHSALDTFENVNKRELELGAASMAMMIYLISEKGLQ